MVMNKIERVLRHDGIVAVLDQTAEQAQAGNDPSWVGDDKWKPIVLEAVKLVKSRGQIMLHLFSFLRSGVAGEHG